MRRELGQLALVSIVGMWIGLDTATHQPRPAVAANCAGISTGLVPLTELGSGQYKGSPGGLYPGGSNTPPAAHLAAAAQRAAAIAPLNTAGEPAVDGRVTLLSIGMSNATQEFSRFVQLANADPQKSGRVLLVDGAQGGQTASVIRNPSANFWTVVDQRLAQAGSSAAQVQVIWLKEANAQPGGQFPADSFPAAAKALQVDIEAVIQVAHARFPNAKLLYLASRTYAGYASTALNPEPYAYEGGFSVKWLIEKQVNGDPALNFDPAKGEVKAPVLLWGPYLWGDGLTPQADGLVWRCEDFVDDGTHPSPSGRHKVASLLLAFFKSDATARGWFMADPRATPAPAPTFDPSTMPTRPPQPTGTRPTPGPTSTGPTPTLTALRSFRVRETPSADHMWVAVRNPQTQQQLDRLNQMQPTWLCGRVRAVAGSEWGFMFDPDNARLVADPPMQATRSTIRAIAANPSAAMIPCINIDRVLETVEGELPAVGTGTPTAVRATDTATPTGTRQIEPTPTPVCVDCGRGGPAYLPWAGGRRG